MKGISRHITQLLNNRWSLLWLLLLFSTAVVHLLLSVSTGTAESIYGVYVWPFWRKVFSELVVPLPFNLLHFLFGILVIWLSYVVWKSIEMRSVLYLSWQLIVLCILFYVSFQWFWGFNYQRPSLEDRLQWQNKSLPADSVKADLLYWTELLEFERDSLPDTPINTGVHHWMYLLNESLHDKVFPRLGYKIDAQLHVRELRPEGTLLRIGTAGFYAPFSGEGQIDPGLHPLQKPFTIAHEMGHAAGITGEGDCNYIGLLACMNTEDVFVRYSGRLAIWRYLASEVKRTDPAWYDSFYKKIDRGIVTDIQAIQRQMAKYPDLFPKLRDRVYDTYLRAQGIEGGMANYSLVVRLVHRTIRDRPELLGDKYGDHLH